MEINIGNVLGLQINAMAKRTSMEPPDSLADIQKLVRLAYILDENYPNTDQKVVTKILECQGADLEYGNRSGLGRHAPIFATICRLASDHNLTFSHKYAIQHNWYPNPAINHPGIMVMDKYYVPQGGIVNPDLPFTLDVLKPNRAMVKTH
jgi:hypothetical protein